MNDDAVYALERLPQSPSRWYLAGFLAPSDAPTEDRSDDDGNEQLDLIDRPGGGDDEGAPDATAARKAFFPSSMGLSVLIPKDLGKLNATVRWGDYALRAKDETEDRPGGWQRIPKENIVVVTPPRDGAPAEVPVPGSEGLQLVVSCSNASLPDLPAGTRSLSVFLVNRRLPAPDQRRDEAFVFQVELSLQAEQAFVPRPDPRGRGTDWDDQVADLQYRDVVELAVGHNVSAVAICTPAGNCSEVRTDWMPAAAVEKVVPNEQPDVDLSLEGLAAASSGAALRQKISPMLTAYAAWIAQQRKQSFSDPRRAQVSKDLLEAADRVRGRIEAGLAQLDDPTILEAFRIANRAVARAMRQRECHGRTDITPEKVSAPRWRPFQLAFILTNLSGLVNERHPDRKIVDLLFFPTGGGKTEAYLGLAAIAMTLRRLRSPSIQSAGTSVLMRYTLRLLTLDQLSRAATLVCALELERQADVPKLGEWPFEIGLWVGMGATPNVMGKKGDKSKYTARQKTIDYQNDSTRKASPIPLESCPWCGFRFSKDSFTLLPDPNEPLDLRVLCVNRDCAFHARKQARGLPLLAVDEPIYRRLPAFLIATVDKFASLPWIGATAGLFGKVTHHDKEGFYGPWAPGKGSPLQSALPPPDLIIQDELHLISGPLGTMVGLYETAIDSLSSNDHVGPKIVASTATVRRAERQICGLFGRPDVEVFPPPGPDRRDSFFARTAPVSEANARLYLGVAAPGRNIKVVFMRTTLTLLCAAQKLWVEAGKEANPNNPVDPYMTLITYFNALRELGGARRIVEDEIWNRAADYGRRRLRVGEKSSNGLFANRKLLLPRELTSREPTNLVAETKQRLALSVSDSSHIDVALATNMISVGLDITRLGLMLVLGQPKMAAEYIQATSRVGRDEKRPGLVVTVLNVNRPRDRSHYERFIAWHESFYRAVEATSVTPFSPRAVDRGIAGVSVALGRLGLADMTAPRNAALAPRLRQKLDFVAEVLSRRAEAHDKELSTTEAEALRQRIRQRVADILDKWVSVAEKRGELQYGHEVGGAPPLLFEPLDPELEKQPAEARAFKAGRSLRDVEPVVNLWIRRPEDFTGDASI
jgi:hypothetical protein